MNIMSLNNPHVYEFAIEFVNGDHLYALLHDNGEIYWEYGDSDASNPPLFHGTTPTFEAALEHIQINQNYPVNWETGQEQPPKADPWDYVSHAQTWLKTIPEVTVEVSSIAAGLTPINSYPETCVFYYVNGVEQWSNVIDGNPPREIWKTTKVVMNDPLACKPNYV